MALQKMRNQLLNIYFKVSEKVSSRGIIKMKEIITDKIARSQRNLKVPEGENTGIKDNQESQDFKNVF